MCSQIDSLTGVNRPIMLFWSDQLYKKWASDPAVRTKKIPMIVYCLKFFMENTSWIVYGAGK